MSQQTTVVWRRIDIPGHESGELRRVGSGWRLSGVAVFSYGGEPFRLEYVIACDAAWRTRRVRLGGWHGSRAVDLHLMADGHGHWTWGGRALRHLTGCLDVDLGFSPSTNLLPIRRLGLEVGASAEVRAAWVQFPGLELHVLEQVYRRTGAETYRYQSAGGAFERDLTVDPSGLVLKYPGLWEAEAQGVISAPEARRLPRSRPRRAARKKG